MRRRDNGNSADSSFAETRWQLQACNIDRAPGHRSPSPRVGFTPFRRSDERSAASSTIFAISRSILRRSTWGTASLFAHVGFAEYNR